MGYSMNGYVNRRRIPCSGAQSGVGSGTGTGNTLPWQVGTGLLEEGNRQ